MALSSHHRDNPKAEEEEETSDEEEDDTMDALKRVFALSGADFNQIQDDPNTDSEDGSGDDDDDDDLEVLRNIQERFSGPDDLPLTLKPLSSLPPVVSDDDEDDFETLRAIEKRFVKYDTNALKKNRENRTNKPELVCDTGVSSKQVTPNSLSGDRRNSISCVDIPSSEVCETSDLLETARNAGSQNQASDSIEWSQLAATDSSTLPLKQVFIDAIKKNRSCQKFIRSKLIELEARIEENKKLKKRVEVLKQYHVSCKKRAGKVLSQKKDARVQLISATKLKASQSMKASRKKDIPLYFGPVKNSHVENYKMMLTQFPVSLGRQRWTDMERQNLGKAIKQQFQEMLLQKSIEHYSEGSAGESNSFDDIISSISDLDITPDKLRSFLPKVDWERLASMYVPGRSGAECEQRWLNVEDPLINTNKWTNVEDKNLLYILQQRGIYNWINISIILRTNRTPFDCLSRYQRSLNANILKQEWTKEDDAKLRLAVEVLPENDWQKIASVLEGRTGTQCSNRWTKSLNPDRTRVGKWSLDEDKRLKVAVTLFGRKNWKKIAQFIPGRTQVQCRERWHNCLDPCLNLGEWTEEEDSRLKAAITEHGYCWSKVAASLPPRTDSQCRRRWKVLSPCEVPLLQAAKKLQKAALISNFVDREAERPALGPADFLAVPSISSICEAENGKKKKSRRKPESQKQNNAAFCDAPRKRPKRSRSEAETCSEDNSRPTSSGVETRADDHNALEKKKRTPKRRRLKRNQPTEPAAANQGILLVPEESTKLNNVEDASISKKKRKVPKQILRRKVCTGALQDNRDCSSSLVEDSRISKKNKVYKRKLNKCTAPVVTAKRLTPFDKVYKRRMKKNKCTAPVQDNQDNSLPSENLSVPMDTNFEISPVDFTAVEERGAHNMQSESGIGSEFGEEHQEFSLHLVEHAQVNDRDTSLPLPAQGKKSNVSNLKEVAKETNDDDLTLASFMRKHRRIKSTRKDDFACRKRRNPMHEFISETKSGQPVEFEDDLMGLPEHSNVMAMDGLPGIMGTDDFTQQGTGISTISSIGDTFWNSAANDDNDWPWSTMDIGLEAVEDIDIPVHDPRTPLHEDETIDPSEMVKEPVGGDAGESYVAEYLYDRDPPTSSSSPPPGFEGQLAGRYSANGHCSMLSPNSSSFPSLGFGDCFHGTLDI